MAASTNNPQVSQPVITSDGVKGRLNASVRITWGPWTVFGVGTSLGASINIQLANLGTIGARFQDIRGCVVDNTNCRSPVVFSNGQNWSLSIDPGQTCYFSIPLNTSNVTVTAVLGNATTDITNIIFTNYDVELQTFKAARYNAYTLPGSVANLNGPGLVGGVFSRSVGLAGTNTAILLNSSAVITRLDVDLVGLVNGAANTQLILTLTDLTTAAMVQWAFSNTSGGLLFPPSVTIPYVKLFSLRLPDYILAPEGLQINATIGTGGFTTGTAVFYGIAQ